MFLVTGGAGFIGSNVVAALAAGGHEVAVCDRLRSEGKWRNLRNHRIAALVAPGELAAWLDRRPPLEAIIHLGAISATTATDGDATFHTNVSLSQQLWEWCAARGVRFVYASSAATYGDGSAGFDDDATPAALARLRPLNLYGWTKHVFDRWVTGVLVAGGASPPQWAGLKFFNVYGPNEYHKGGMISVVKVKYDEIASGKPARLFRSDRPEIADGEQRRDFVHVDDCVDAITWLLANPHVCGLFNLGTGQARTYLELVHAIFAALGREPEIAYIDMPAALRGQYQSFTEARMDRLRLAGWPGQPTPLEAGIARYVQGYLGQPDPYR